MHASSEEAKRARRYSRRHPDAQANQDARERYGTRTERKRRRRQRAFKRREADLMRYQLGHFHPFENWSESSQQRKLDIAELDVSRLEAKLA